MDPVLQPTTPETVIIPDDNAPPEPIEIDLESGETTEGTTPAQAADPAKPIRRNKSSERIQTLARERDNERAMREQIEQQLVQARAEAVNARTEAAQATRSGMENYAQRVKTEADAAQNELEQAIAAGDANAQAAANRKVAKIAAAEADVDAWRASQPAAPDPGAQPQPQPRPQPQQQDIPQVSEPTRQFFEEHAYFHPVQLGSDGRPLMDRSGRVIANPEFDENMHDAAMLIHKRIAWEIQKGKWDGQIESPEYFQRIAKGMQAQFPEYFEGDDAEPPPVPTRKTPPMAQARQPVAPATRTAMPGTAKPGGSKVTLSGEERQFVDSMVANGAMRYPSSHAKAGKPMEAKDAYLEYARQSQISRANQQSQ